MAFVRSGFRGIGGYNRGFVGGQRYSYVNTDDTLAEIKVSGYFDLVANAVGANDLIDLIGSDGATTVGVGSGSVPVTVFPQGSGGVVTLTTAAAAGVLDPTASFIQVTTTGTDVLSLADGTFPGQQLIVNIAVDGGSGAVTPTTAAFTNVALLAAGDNCTLVWAGATWNCAAVAGTTAPVIT